MRGDYQELGDSLLNIPQPNRGGEKYYESFDSIHHSMVADRFPDHIDFCWPNFCGLAETSFSLTVLQTDAEKMPSGLPTCRELRAIRQQLLSDPSLFGTDFSRANDQLFL